MTIAGTNFVSEPTVLIGGLPCDVESFTSTSVVCVSPVHSVGWIDVSLHVGERGSTDTPDDSVKVSS